MFKRKVKYKDLKNNDKCSFCGRPGHTSLECFRKPHTSMKTIKKVIRPESKKSEIKRKTMAAIWFQNNHPDENGNYKCYLKISKLCNGLVSREFLTLEHVYPRSKYPELKFEHKNIKPACQYCNKLKGSNTIEKLALIYPHINIMIQTPEWTEWRRGLNIKIIS